MFVRVISSPYFLTIKLYILPTVAEYFLMQERILYFGRETAKSVGLLQSIQQHKNLFTKATVSGGNHEDEKPVEQGASVIVKYATLDNIGTGKYYSEEGETAW